MKLKINQLIFWAALILIISLFVVLVGFTFSLLILLLFWILFYILFFTRWLKIKLIAGEYFWIIFFLLVVFSLSLPIYLKLKSNNLAGTDNKTESQKTLTKDECLQISSKYNNKIINVSSENLVGRIAIRVTDQNTCHAEIVHHYLFSADLPQRQATAPDYMGYTSEKSASEDRSKWNGNGGITAVYSNKDQLPSDPYLAAIYLFYNQDLTQITGPTDKFAIGYVETPILTEATYQKIFDENKLYIIDGREFIINEMVDNSMTQRPDEEIAAKKGPIVKTFVLQFSE